MRFFSERPYLISLMLIILVAIWMFAPQAEKTNNSDSPVASEKKLQKVQVRVLSTEQTELELVFTGRTEPNQRAEIASELDGLLTAYIAERGATIKKGAIIAEINAGSLAAALDSAKAEQRSAAIDYKAQSDLVKKGVNAQNSQTVAFAALQASNARVQQAELELKKASVLAPFDGIVAEHSAEVGDFMNVGRALATLIDLDPIRAVGDVSERDVASLSVGNKATIVMLNGQEVDGEVSYISPFADDNTRTFRVEVTLPNVDGNLVAGLTTQVKVPLRNASAYKISPALLTLNAEGDIQVATVDASNRVEVFEVDLIRSETDGIWVTGLPENARIITLGQGFVYTGDLVDPVEEETKKVSSTAVEN